MDNKSEIRTLLNEAWNQRRSQHYKEARKLTEQAQKICAKNDFGSLGRIFHIYMQLESDQDNPDKALSYSKKSSEYYKKANDLDRMAHSIRHMADLQRKLDHDSDSLNSYKNAINIYNSNAHTNTIDLANALRGYALTLVKNNQRADAKKAWEKARELYKANHIQEGVDEADKELESLSK